MDRITNTICRLQTVILNKIYTFHGNIEGKTHLLKKARRRRRSDLDFVQNRKAPLENVQHFRKDGSVMKYYDWTCPRADSIYRKIFEFYR